MVSASAEAARPSLRRLLGILTKLALSAAGGLLLAMAYPPAPTGALAWIALVPVLFAVSRSRPPASFLFGVLAGAVYYSLAFQWTEAFHPFALPFVCAVEATVFFGLPLLCIKPFLRHGLVAAAAAPSIWVVFEFVKQSWFLQFPFGVLGYTQWSWVYLIQVADLGGTALVSWLIVLVNAAIFIVIDRLILARQDPGRWRAAAAAGAAAIVALGASLAYGAIRVAGMTYEPQPRLKVGYAQTFFRPGRNGAGQRERLAALEGFVKELHGLGVGLVIFPELTLDRAVTYETRISLADNAATLNRISTLARTSGMNLLFGSLEMRERGGRVRTYNAMQMFTPDGNLSDIYRKSVLVPFGETNPFEAVFPGLSDYLQRTTKGIQLDRGDTPHLFTVSAEGAPLRFGVLICFESCFGGIARRYVRDGARFLVSATDDSWSFSSVAMYQHAVMSIFRAVETRTPVLRVSNGGVSGYFDERGKFATSLPLFSAGAMTSRLYLLGWRPRSLYVRAGDWFVVFSLIVAALFTWILLRRARRPAGATPSSSAR